MKQLKFIPLIRATDLPDEVIKELEEDEIQTHYQSDVLSLNWDGIYYPEFRKYLIESYGESIKEYSQFAIQAT